jgi:hypothetical protein
MRILQSLILTSLLVFPFLSNAATCPPVKELVRTQGEYSWFSNTPGWEGGFIAPTPGKGSSTFIGHFMGADWVQLNNKAESLGYVVCNYKGNYDDEVIRFTQTDTRKGRHEKEMVSKRPVSVNWNCKIQPDYPSTACTCSGQIDHCTFTSN